MACLRQIKNYKRSRNRQWQLAKKMARLEGVPYVLYKKQNGEYSFCRQGESYNGVEIEIIR